MANWENGRTGGEIPRNIKNEIANVIDNGIARLCYNLKLFPKSCFYHSSQEELVSFKWNQQSPNLAAKCHFRPAVIQSSSIPEDQTEFPDLSPLTLTMALDESNPELSFQFEDNEYSRKRKRDQPGFQSSLNSPKLTSATNASHSIQFSLQMHQNPSVYETKSTRKNVSKEENSCNKDMQILREWLYKGVDHVFTNGIINEVVFEVSFLHNRRGSRVKGIGTNALIESFTVRSKKFNAKST